jgi:hypothetical protein
MDHHTRGVIYQTCAVWRHGTRPGRAWLTALAAAVSMIVLVSGCGGQSSGPGVLGMRSSPAEGGGGTGGAGVANYGPVSPAQESSGLGRRSGVNSSALFGGTATLVGQEGKLGRKLAIVRVYYRLGQHFPTASDRRLMAGGRTLLVSLDTTPGGSSYASIAAGYQDAAIGGFLKAMNRTAVRYHLNAIYFAFEHEVDASSHHGGLGSPGQFIQAWDHLRRLAQSANLDWRQGGRLHWVWILTHEAFVPVVSRPQWARRFGSPTAYWPGKSEVDIVAADGYDNYGCQLTSAGSPASPANAVTPASRFSPVLSFAHANGGLPVFIAEWGSTAIPSSRQSGFIREMQAFVTANREIAAALYWNSNGPTCSFKINPYPASIAALAVMGRSAALQGRLAPS